MSKYQNEYSNFPNEKIKRHNFLDVTDEVSSIINQINTLRSQGQYIQAAQLLQEKKAILSQYIVDAEIFRKWEDEIHNTQKYAKQVQQSIYFEENEEDVDALEGDVWIGV